MSYYEFCFNVFYWMFLQYVPIVGMISYSAGWQLNTNIVKITLSELIQRRNTIILRTFIVYIICIYSSKNTLTFTRSISSHLQPFNSKWFWNEVFRSVEPWYEFQVWFWNRFFTPNWVHLNKLQNPLIFVKVLILDNSGRFDDFLRFLKIFRSSEFPVEWTRACILRWSSGKFAQPGSDKSLIW